MYVRVRKTELEKTDSEKSELEKFKERHGLEKLDGVMIHDKPTIKTGEKAGGKAEEKQLYPVGLFRPALRLGDRTD